MSRYRPTKSIIIACALLIVSCVHKSSDDDAMMALESNLPAIADAVDSQVTDVGASPDLDGVALVAAATAHDPTLMAAFKNWYVTAHKQNGFTSVLVCDSERRYAVLEDTACTSRLDATLWREQPQTSCDFKLDLPVLCK